MTSIIADIIHYFHAFIVLFILTGNFYIPSKYLVYFIVFVILTIMGWNDLFGACILTKLEYYFRTGIWSNKSAKDEGGPEFFRPFIKSITGIDMTREEADKLNNTLFLSIILISFLRFYYYHIHNCDIKSKPLMIN